MSFLSSATLRAAVFFMLSLPAIPAFSEEIPLWEGIQKNSFMLEADKRFVEGIRAATNGRLDNGAKHSIKRGWEAFNKEDYETAIRRFNQAWLLNPEDGALYWGLALTTHLRGDGPEIVERWFGEAEKRLPNVAELLSDHGRTLEENDKPEQAIAYFKRALELNPNVIEAHIGMIHAVNKTGDKEAAEFHLREVERLRKDAN